MYEDEHLDSVYDERYENDYQVDESYHFCPHCENEYDYCECDYCKTCGENMPECQC